MLIFLASMANLQKMRGKTGSSAFVPERGLRPFCQGTGREPFAGRIIDLYNNAKLGKIILFCKPNPDSSQIIL